MRLLLVEDEPDLLNGLARALRRASYAVESTPKLVLLDGVGIVRGSYLGWGRQTPQEVQEELKNWLPPR